METIEVVPRLEIPRRDDPATVWDDASTGNAIAKLGSPQSPSAPPTFMDRPNHNPRT
jgi:hypothetical protein